MGRKSRALLPNNLESTAVNTREENAAAVAHKAQEIPEKQGVRRAQLLWAREWHEGEARCPICGGTEFGIPDVKHEDHARYESFRCKSCSAEWSVQFSEAAVAVGREDDADGDWIELEMFDEYSAIRISGRERAATLAALRYWRREGPTSAGHERDTETDHGRLKALSAEEIDALCERIQRFAGDQDMVQRPSPA